MSVRDFVKRWSKVTGERSDMQSFWFALIRDVLGEDKPENFIRFELPVRLTHKSFIDAYFPDTKVIIEQKSSSVNLNKEITQSDGTKLTAYQQAKRYSNELPLSQKPRWIVTCNFKEFLIYDMETLEEPTQIFLSELPDKPHALDFLIDVNKTKLRIELELSLKAGQIVAKIYDALLAQYVDPDNPDSLVSLNKLCVRLVFCLYAESSGIFGKHKIFREYLEDSRDIRRDLIDLFKVLNTPKEMRSPYLSDLLNKFPYVNGGLFADTIEIPKFTKEIRILLLDEASSNFNWSGISPTIFGAVFESTINPQTRRAGGMHYTSVENIHKVIDNLFLDNLRTEFLAIKSRKKLLAFQNKIAAIKILDPACGSGNFLTESYLSLRRLENDVLKKILGSQITMGELDNPIKVSIAQFFGIEINDFAVAVTQTALWIAELQMMQETQKIIHRDLDYLPLKSYSNIYEGNALRLDWQKIFPPDINYIIGNPPFVGMTYQTPQQKSDLCNVDKRLKPLDYVTGWYKLAADFIRDKKTSCAFVSTNSITQGEQVGTLWNILNVNINFAYRTFIWNSESDDVARVHCVVIGFSAAPNNNPKFIFDGGKKISAQNINGYLLDAPNIYAIKRNKPICDISPMCKGSQPTDDGNFLFKPEECEDFIKHEPSAVKWIRPFVGADEFIKGKQRFCLWLKDCPPNELRKMPSVYRRIKAVQNFRLASKKNQTRSDAERPAEFQEIRQPTTNYILVPRHSSKRRKYIPMGYLNANMIAGDSTLVIPNATLYHFGVLTSSIHMAWMRTVCGRLKSDYRYSATIVYNNFPWYNSTAAQKELIETTAQKILEVRKKYPQSTLADLYDDLTMPQDLRKAHRANDKAVAAAYGLSEILDDENAIVAALFRIYSKLVRDR
ncbi:MAG: methylase [Selenomonadaceae bacterium]|nr:methylase [Selenomonadaceae bacterium]